MDSILEILIPTFNRADFLERNLNELCQQISFLGKEDLIFVSVSDNASEDHTAQIVNLIKEEYPTIHLNYFTQYKNIGLEPNVVSLMQKAAAKYVMWLGDDDYLAKGYLDFVWETITNENVGCIIPGIQNVFKDGSIQPARIADYDVRKLPPGFDSVLEFSHLGHQMSGIVLLRDHLIDSYLEKPQYRNPYLFIYWVAQCLLKWGGKYAPQFKTSITTFNEKDWGYNKVGLIDEVFRSYYFFEDQLDEGELTSLLLRFSVQHSYRYRISWRRPFRLLRQYLYIINTVPNYRGLKINLLIQLVKDYVISFRK
ncbi:MAG: glycosyltransferase [Cyclobacteriaceae bacterium]